MFQPWRLKLREASEALKAGQLEQASQLLSHSEVRDYLPAKKLLAKVADQFAQRARGRADRGETKAGWHDLEAARRLGAGGKSVTKLRQRFATDALGEAERYLAAGDGRAAIERLDQLLSHDASARDARLLRQVAVKVDNATRLARHGKHGQAEAELQSALAIRSGMTALKTLRDQHKSNGQRYRELTQKLHEALGREDWSEVVDVAEAMLEVAPESEPARDARRRAWQAVGTNLKDTRHTPRAVRRQRGEPVVAMAIAEQSGTEQDDVDPSRAAVANAARGRQSVAIEARQVSSPQSNQQQPLSDQFLLWVDAVGGFWVCPSDRIVVGRPDAGRQADIPVLGDLARQHLIIHRAAEGYIVEPLARVSLSGKLITTSTTLPDGAILELNETVRLRFTRPHPLSGSARLDFVSRHRTQPATDAILLMSDSCILGPGANCHVRCPEWPRDVILYRQGGELMCRSDGPFEIDGVAVEKTGTLATQSHVTGDEFSLTLESV